jgi:hypothetical protein
MKKKIPVALQPEIQQRPCAAFDAPGQVACDCGRSERLHRAHLRSTLQRDLASIHQRVRDTRDGSSAYLTTLEQLVLVLEDRRYFSHPGVDVLSLLREFGKAMTLRRYGGASTIEMQFVRTVTGYRQNTLHRKLYEMLLAMTVRKRYSKIELLRAYLACAFFGSGLIGADATAALMFGKNARKLRPDEAAVVAAMLARPRPLLAPASWETKVRRRARYGLRIWASKWWSWSSQSNVISPASHLHESDTWSLFKASRQPPPPDDPANPVKVVDAVAIGPSGTAFATVEKGGFVTYGSTTVSEWLAAKDSGQNLSPSVLRIVRAVSLNEGRFEAVNSYDSSVLSFGIFQWAVGPGDRPGELAGLLDSIRQLDCITFEECFGRYGLGVALVANAPGWPSVGYLTLEGGRLLAREAKQELRQAQWAYRFWRSGHDDVVRRCQLETAIARIQAFYGKRVGGRSVADWITSEYGVALLLDQHINQPAHVLETLRRAIAGLPAHIAECETSQWGDSQERALVKSYLQERNGTAMTTPVNRAGRILDCIREGSLSDRRGSFAA